MGWQLIYTSASRLLEAGRSGFGTVARHREIPPLLAAAIERTSQFNRGPGLDESRIIYSHRHVTVSGSRYSVLSRIRSAGSDYTGRTNHIAHHLIFEAREIAAQGRESASPVDVMLSAPWLDRWEEQPRYLGVADELPLAGFNHRMELPAQSWNNLTGNSRSAALLATADAIRGAYLVWKNLDDQQPEWPLYLFGESLLLLPDRRWSISFTSNLQPSDEAADFQWRCLPSGSPLRAQAEQSGRPLFDLNSTLPAVNGELAQVAESGSIAKRRVARQPDVVGNAQETRSPAFTLVDSSSPVVSTLPPKGTSRTPSQKRTTPYWMPAASQRSRNARRWIALAVTGVGIFMLIGFCILKWEQHQRTAAENNLHAAITAADININTDDAWTFLRKNQTASITSLNDTVARFAKLAAARKRGSRLSEDEIAAIFASDVYYQSEMRQWLKPIETPTAAPSATPEIKATQLLALLAKPEKPRVQSLPSQQQTTPIPADSTSLTPFLENLPKIPTYLIIGNKGLANEDLHSVNFNQVQLVLIKQNGAMPPETKLGDKIFFGADWVFSFQNASPHIVLDLPGQKPPDPPYSLLGKDGDATQFEIKVLDDRQDLSRPFFAGKLPSGLHFDSDLLRITIDAPLEALRKNLPQQDKLLLELPSYFPGLQGEPRTIPFAGFVGDLRNLSDTLRNQIAKEGSQITAIP